MIHSIASFILRIATERLIIIKFIGYFARYANLIFSTDWLTLLNPFTDLPITSRIAISSGLGGCSGFPHRAADESTLNLALATHVSLCSRQCIKSTSLMLTYRNFIR